MCPAVFLMSPAVSSCGVLRFSGISYRYLLFVYKQVPVQNMADKAGWPNVKDQYELLDVIGSY